MRGLSSLDIIDVEEVRIKKSLDDACYNGDWLEVSLRKVTVQPIRDVQGSV